MTQYCLVTPRWETAAASVRCKILNSIADFLLMLYQKMIVTFSGYLGFVFDILSESNFDILSEIHNVGTSGQVDAAQALLGKMPK